MRRLRGLRRRSVNRWIPVLAALIALAWLPSGATAQSKWAFEAQGGVGIPVSDLADLTDPGVTFGVGVAYWLSSRLAIRVDGDVEILNGKDSSGPGSEGPDINLFHYNGGLQLALTPPDASAWSIRLNAGAGATTFDSDEFSASGSTVDFSETYFTVNGGLAIGYDVSQNVSIFLDGQWYLAFTDEEDTAIFAEINPEIDAMGFDTASSVPLTLGIRITTN